MADFDFKIPVMPPYMELSKFDYPITPRENIMRAFHHEKPMWMPALYEDTQWVFPSVYNDMPLDFSKDGEDWFGTKYKYMEVQEGPTPVPGLFNEIGEWREKFIYPDLDAFDWAKDKPTFVRNDTLALATRLGNGTFERLHFCEGFEQALCDVLLEPEACKEFFDRYTDYKVECLHRIKDVYPLDYVCNNDDWANARAQFFSLDVFESTLLDSAIKLADEIHRLGCSYMLHCCGKMEAFLPYIVNDLHADVLEIQTLNDLRMVLDKYGAKTSPIFSPDPYIMYNPATTVSEAREYARYIVDNYGAHTCDGAGALIYLRGSIKETFYAFADEIYHYSMKCYENLQ